MRGRIKKKKSIRGKEKRYVIAFGGRFAKFTNAHPRKHQKESFHLNPLVPEIPQSEDPVKLKNH